MLTAALYQTDTGLELRVGRRGRSSLGPSPTRQLPPQERRRCAKGIG